MLPLEDEYAELDAELGQARRDLWRSERAEFYHRVTDQAWHQRTLKVKRDRVAGLERERNRLREILEDDAA